MSNRYTIYDFIEEQLPNTEGYGNIEKELDDNHNYNHSVFHQSIREDNEGDVGIFIVDSKDNYEMKMIPMIESEIQVVVNAVSGDIEGTLEYLDSLFITLKNSKGNDKIEIFRCNKINLRPVGKNSADIHWCVLNMLVKYRYK